MGRLKDNRLAFQRNTILDSAQAPKPVILPIFGKTFEGHGVINPNVVAGREALAKRNAVSRGFEGESEEGWGFHTDMTVDCINITKTKCWNIQDNDSWETFMGMEMLPEEVGLKDPAQAIISRLVVTIMLLPTGITFIPYPRFWSILLSYTDNPVSGVYGSVCPRPVSDADQREQRMKMAKRRKSILENCL